MDEAFPTLLAFKGLFSHVDPLVPNEQRPVREALLALGALIKLFPGVRLLVDDEVGALPEALPALVALVGLLPRVDSLVHDEVGALAKPPPALLARIFLLPGSSSTLGFGAVEDFHVPCLRDEMSCSLHILIFSRPPLSLGSCLWLRVLVPCPFAGHDASGDAGGNAGISPSFLVSSCRAQFSPSSPRGASCWGTQMKEMS